MKIILKKMNGGVFLAVLVFARLTLFGQDYNAPWLSEYSPDSSEKIENIKLPAGFVRVKADKNSFAEWLRHLPLLKAGSKVHLYNKRMKGNQQAHFRIINMDVGSTDLQQCADAVIRLRAEYLYNRKRFAEIHFKFTSGHTAKFEDWVKGFRPLVSGNKVRWQKSAAPDSGYAAFRQYLNTVFMYAGSYSLSKELIPVSNLTEVEIGDVFIQGGFPGHAIIVLDKARHGARIALLLGQSYMPAQEIHVLKNPRNQRMSPWYILGEGEKLYTPEWTFEWNMLKRFK